MEKSIACKLHTLHGCSICFYPANFAANDAKRFNAGGVGMDRSSIINPQSRSRAPRNLEEELALGKLHDAWYDRTQATANDAAPLSADELRMVRQALEIGSRKPARRSAPATHDTFGKVASSEDINVLYARLKEEKRNEPAYVYEQD
jgi:hypothetical protein